ncbi:hypothetical protein [Rhizobium sp. No.120]
MVHEINPLAISKSEDYSMRANQAIISQIYNEIPGAFIDAASSPTGVSGIECLPSSII